MRTEKLTSGMLAGVLELKLEPQIWNPWTEIIVLKFELETEH